LDETELLGPVDYIIVEFPEEKGEDRRERRRF
jgi:hypothetical protein